MWISDLKAGPSHKAQGLLPTTTAAPARVRLFQPTQRPTPRSGEWIETSFGRCRVTGRLGQRHADVLEGILFCASRVQRLPDGSLILLCDPARARRALGGSYSGEQMWILLRELRAATVEIEIEARGLRAMGGLLDEVVEAATRARNPLGGDRPLWRVRIGRCGQALLEQDLHLTYDPRLVARLSCGVSQAVARHVLTHSCEPRGGWRLDTLIEAVCGPLPAQTLRDRRRELRRDVAGLAALGIQIEGDRVRRGGVEQPPDAVEQPPDF